MKQRLIIAGAGAAGLYAATLLTKKFEVTVIEAQTEPGGRIRSIATDHAKTIVEAGAEFVHGKLPITQKLIKEAGLHIDKVDGKMWRKEGNEWSEQKEMIEGWDALLKKMKGQRANLSMQEFLDKHFSDDRFADLRRHVKLYVQGFDLADPGQVSVQSLYREWAAEEDQFRIREGYGKLVSHLEKKAKDAGCTFMYGEAIRQVDWQKNDVTVYTSTKKIAAEKLLVTLPVSVMRSVGLPCSVNFTPPIDEHIRAFHDIGFGNVIKVIFDFHKSFWKEDTAFIFSDEMIPTWWTHFPLENTWLTGWAGGPAADRIAVHSDLELKEIGIQALSNIFNIPLSEMKNNLRHSYVFNWMNADNAKGAYSFSTPKSNAARKLLKTPLAATVFFAGEGLFGGEYPGTVEAALKSAKDAVSAITRTMK